MSHLKLKLLGPPSLERDERLLNLGRRREMALLAYLAVGQQSYSRESLATFFWPDADRLRAQANLRNVLSRLRLTLGEEYILVERPLVSLNTDRLWTDTVEFERRLGQSQTHRHRPGELCPTCLAALTGAADLYRDDFLAGFGLSDSPAFDEWQAAQSERLRQQLAGVLEQLTRAYSTRGEFETAILYARRRLALDPLHEPAHVSLMQLYAWDGQYVAAVRQYEECARLLKEELGEAPREETRRLFQAILRREESDATPSLLPVSPLVLNVCPYRSLHAFREEDAALFFGRELFTERLLEAVERQNCVAIVGPSGSGKSSVAQAGLLPRLRADERWVLLPFRPGDQPFQALAATLVPLLEPDLPESGRLAEATQLAQAFSQGLSLQTVGHRLGSKYADCQHLLLVIDQFEELYTLTPASLRRRFLELLLAAMDYQYPNPTYRFTVVLTLRADFLGQVLAFRPLADVLQDSLFVLGPMTRQELKRAIENPARRQGIYFQEGLVERILDDVGQEPGNLPLLQFALTLLWESQVGTRVLGVTEAWPVMTHAAYEKLGRVEGALARYADQVYERLDGKQQNQARRIFERMVRPGLGTEHTRSLANRADMGEEDWALVQHLADARLVVTGRNPTGQEVVEVAHEALLSAWGRLHSWLEQDQEFLLWRHRLQAAQRQWEASGCDEGALLRGVPLVEAEEWLSQREGDLSAVEHLFIADSVALRQREMAAREVERVAVARRQRRFTLALALMFALAVAAAFIAINRQSQAEGERRLAQARELAGRATETVGRDPELALLLALRAFNVTYTNDGAFVPEARLALNHTLLSLYRATLRGHSGEVWSAQFSPDGSLLVTASADGSAILWQMPDGRYLTTLKGHAAAVTSATFNLDGSRILTTSEDGVARLWQGVVGGEAGEAGRPIAALIGRVATFSPDGLWVASGDAEGVVRLWRSGDGERMDQKQATSPAAVTSLAFSPDGTRLVSTHTDGAAWLWRDLPILTPFPLSLPGRGAGGEGAWAAFTPDGARLVTVSPNGAMRLWRGMDGALVAELVSEAAANGAPGSPAISPDQAISFSPDSAYLAAAGPDNVVRLWRAADGALHATLAEHQDTAWSARFSPDSARLVTGSADGSARLWRVADGALLNVMRGHTFFVLSAAFKPDGTRIVTTSLDNTARLWDGQTGNFLVELSGHERVINQVVFSPDGAYLATASSDNTVRLWSAQDGVLSGHADWVLWAGFSPDGRRLATASFDRTVRLWNGHTGAQMALLTGFRDWAQLGSFSPDSTRLAIGSRDGTVRLWRARDGVLLDVLEGHAGVVRTTRFSLDGSLLVTASRDNTARVWDAFGRGLVATLRGHTDTVMDAHFLPDGQQVVTASLDGTARLWDSHEGTLLMTLTGHTAGLRSLNISADGRRILTGGYDGTAKVWDSQSGALLATLEGHTGLITAVNFSSDGRLILTASADGTARLWDGDQYQLLHSLEGHARWVNAAVFSPDDRLIVTVSNDGTAEVWETQTGAPIAILRGHSDVVWSAAFSPDGSRLVTSSYDGTARLWQPFVDIEAMLAEANRRVSRRLTDEECRLYLHLEQCPAGVLADEG